MPCKANRHAPCKPRSHLAVASVSPSINAAPHQTNPCHARVATAVHCKLSSRYTSNCLWLAKPTATTKIGSHCSSYQPSHLIKIAEYQASPLAAIRHHVGHHGKALLLAHLSHAGFLANFVDTHRPNNNHSDAKPYYAYDLGRLPPHIYDTCNSSL